MNQRLRPRGQAANLFTGFNKKYKIFSRKTNSGTRTLPALVPRYAQQTTSDKDIPVTNKNKTKQTISVTHNGLDNAIDAVLVSEFMPASVVINHQLEIVQFRGTTDLFLTHPKGKATFNILKMARPEIAFELRNAISKVIKSKHRFRKSGIEIKVNSDVRSISVEVVPLKIESDEPLILILFTEQEQTEIFAQQAEGGKNNSLAKDRRIKKLEQELAAAHADALAISQEQEAYTEELQSANEEVVSSNEELQTVNEELETSKEEIESANEELTTTNQELQTRNDLLNEAYGYSEAVFATIHEPMLVLDKNLRVKSANKTFYKIFNVKEEDTEGVLLYDLGNKQWNIPRLRELLEDLLPKNTHFHDFEITHTFPLIGEKTMLLNARRIIQKMNHEELILLAISDITERRQAERTSSLLSTIVESSYDAIISKTLDGIITSWNKGAEKIFGYRPEQAIGKNISMLIPPELDHEEDMVIGKIKKGQTVLHYDTVRLTKKGVRVNISITVSPIKDKEGKIIGASKIARDITEQLVARKQIEESEQRFRQLVDSMPQKITNADAEGNVIFYNQQWINETGYSMQELLDGGSKKVMHPEDFERTTDSWQNAVKTGTIFEVECRILNKELGYRWNIARAVPIKDESGKTTMWIGSTTDIHEQKEAKSKAETAQLAAEDSMQAKQQFLVNMSHEIRTPMNSIIGFTNVLLKSKLDKAQEEYLTAIKVSGDALLVLINDILDLAKVDAGKMTFEQTPFNLATSLSAMFQLFDIKIKEKNLELVEHFDTAIPEIISGDSLRLRQIILNLISNAVKFTDARKNNHACCPA